MYKGLYTGVLLACALSGCASMSASKVGGSPELRVLDQASLPEPMASDYRASPRPYALGAFDKLRIDVVGLPELSLEEVQADAGGNISVPLAGTIQIGGMTADEVSQEVASRLRAAHVRDPKVAVNLRETNSQVVTIEGEVDRPGQYPALGNMTLLSLVAKAEGTSEFARLDEVIIFRTVDNQRYAALYNLAAIRRGAYVDPAVFANDVVVVGDSPQRRLFRDLLQVVPLITTPLVIALQSGNN
ncbi:MULTISPECIES: polysaccharide biosynthesis/export family protein [unclassified Sphingopyxis]|uniref:polysaccharide biosynthesis/export family protein n=1 Tax=unclassified Sphingopyxis TaxID=2614943 RepID=UPI000AD38477|nr:MULTISPECIES: polysaccharide biosynthesis/export family protein [unclassified Sphingopyxis]